MEWQPEIPVVSVDLWHSWSSFNPFLVIAIFLCFSSMIFCCVTHWSLYLQVMSLWTTGYQTCVVSFQPLWLPSLQRDSQRRLVSGLVGLLVCLLFPSYKICRVEERRILNFVLFCIFVTVVCVCVCVWKLSILQVSRLFLLNVFKFEDCW